MTKILSFHNLSPGEIKEGFLKKLWLFWSSLDKFIKSMIIIFILLIVVTPAITTQYLDIRQRAVTFEQTSTSECNQAGYVGCSSTKTCCSPAYCHTDLKTGISKCQLCQEEGQNCAPGGACCSGLNCNRDYICVPATSVPIIIPTSTPTSTPVPTSTPIPTNTPIPTSTPIPTAIPTSTSTPTPTPAPTTPPQPTSTPSQTPIPTNTPTPIPTNTPTPLLPSDVNHDGCVNIQDFNIWSQAAVSQTVQPGTYPDINKDGLIDILDFNLWYQVMKSGQNVCP